ncbi:CsbD family protein [soil metagenome]
MNWSQIEGKWAQFSGQMRSKWAKLTNNDDWALIGSKKDQLLGKLQEHYGYKKDQAEKEVDDYIASL